MHVVLPEQKSLMNMLYSEWFLTFCIKYIFWTLFQYTDNSSTPGPFPFFLFPLAFDLHFRKETPAQIASPCLRFHSRTFNLQSHQEKG